MRFSHAIGAVFVAVFLLLPTTVVFAQSTSTTKTPEENLKCWSQEACTIDADKSGQSDGIWDNTTEQAKEECGGGTFGYCYPPIPDLELNVSIPGGGGSVSTVRGMGEYINTLYAFLLGFSAMVAIVMIMIAGVQYVLASGSGNVAMAKTRIMNALTGMVLLMFAALILATVNPQLLRLEPPMIPRVRQVVFYGENTTCEFFLNKDNHLQTFPGATKGYTLNTAEDGSGTNKTSGKCGDSTPTNKTYVVTDPVGNPVSDPFTCRWVTCLEPGTPVNGVAMPPTCVNVENVDRCVSCNEVTASVFSDYSASPGMCTQLNPYPKGAPIAGVQTTQPGTWPKGQYGSCVYSTDLDMSGAAKVSGLCTAVAFDCGSISSCEDYDGVVISGGYFTNVYLDNLEGPGMFYDYTHHKTVCTENPCEIVGGCHQTVSTGWALTSGVVPIGQQAAASAAVNCVPN